MGQRILIGEKDKTMIQIERDGSLLILRLNRPEKANALSKAMLSSIESALVTKDISALILTGEGKVFSAGADLEEMQSGLGADPVWERVSGAIAGFGGLSIAALNGTLAGGAMGMALACDLRIAVPTAKFFYPVMRLGFLPQPSDGRRLAALIGPARSKMILMAGARIEAAEALDWGLIDRIVDAPDLLTSARSLAADVIAAKPGHAAAIKALIG